VSSDMTRPVLIEGFPNTLDVPSFIRFVGTPRVRECSTQACHIRERLGTPSARPGLNPPLMTPLQAELVSRDERPRIRCHRRAARLLTRAQISPQLGIGAAPKYNSGMVVSYPALSRTDTSDSGSNARLAAKPATGRSSLAPPRSAVA
jgi:hypothetical protein